MRTRLSLAPCCLCLLLAGAPATACDTDADCGAGGTCIKREKRASGVCYGGSGRAAQPETGTAPSIGDPVTGEERQRATDFLGDPDRMIEQHLPGREVGGKCTVTTDCAPGFDCVHAAFEGRCVKL